MTTDWFRVLFAFAERWQFSPEQVAALTPGQFRRFVQFLAEEGAKQKGKQQEPGMSHGEVVKVWKANRIVKSRPK